MLIRLTLNGVMAMTEGEGESDQEKWEEDGTRQTVMEGLIHGWTL